MLAIVLGALDGISPQYWSVPGQLVGARWQRPLIGALAPLCTIALIAVFCAGLDRVVSLGDAHPLLATGAGVILIGLAACSCFAIVADLANGDWSPRPVNLLAALVPARARAVYDFIPTPAALAALCLALVVGDWPIGLTTLASYAVSFLVGTITVAASKQTARGGGMEQPPWLVSQFFVLAPIVANVLVVIAAAIIMHASLEIDPFIYH